MTRGSIPPESPEMAAAYERVFQAIRDITSPSPRMPKPKSFEEFMADLRSRGYDDVFTTENPGP
jgi:hypothetical protein